MNRTSGTFATFALCALLVSCGDAASTGTGATPPTNLPATVDPGTGPWDLVARDRVLEECRLDVDEIDAANDRLDRPWAIVRYGKLCHEYYPDGSDSPTALFSATKTMAATVMGMAVQETAGFSRTSRKTGPISDTDRVDHWLDDFTFNQDAQIGHLLGMVAFNEDLSYGAKEHVYDAGGQREINRLSDIVNIAIDQDSERLGGDLEEFWQRFMVRKLGMRDSVWSEGRPDKSFASQWFGTVRDMARLGLLLMNDGVWNEERLLGSDWIYKITHPSFEDANTSYGYLTWLQANSNYHFGGIAGGAKFQVPLDPCAPAAINATFPHGISQATDCNYESPWTCDQEFDVGVWTANGAGGQMIMGHPGLDLVVIVKNLGPSAIPAQLWGQVRDTVIAADPMYQGDGDAFCAAYSAGGYAPDRKS